MRGLRGRTVSLADGDQRLAGKGGTKEGERKFSDFNKCGLRQRSN